MMYIEYAVRVIGNLINDTFQSRLGFATTKHQRTPRLTDSCQPPRSTNDSIWYVLATIAGEPTSVYDSGALVKANAHYWNALMAKRIEAIGPSIQSVEHFLGHELAVRSPTAEDDKAIRRALDKRGFEGVPLPAINSTIDFTDLTFPYALSFDEYLFVGDVSFNNCRFLGDIFTFHDAIFTGPTTFNGADFRSFVSFARTEFVYTPEFRDTEFHELANFSGARFPTGVRFEKTKFLSTAHFNNIEFGDSTYFSGCQFDQNVTFRKSDFKAETHFDEVVFKTQVPNFFESVLYEYTDWHGAQWPRVPVKVSDAREQVQFYQRLVHLMSELRKIDDQHSFFRREMRARRRVDGMSISTTMNWLYAIVCDYGHGLGRITSIWLLHIVIGAVLIWSSKVVTSSEPVLSSEYIFHLVSDFFFALGISFSNAHGLLALDRSFLKEAIESWTSLPFFSVIGGVQTTLGVILLFFLLLTVRNRFRMR